MSTDLSEKCLKKRIFIQDSILQFINLHSKSTVVDIDEIVLDYVVSVISEDTFELEEFVEMLSAYFPNFDSIPQPAVLSWVQDLLNGIKNITSPKPNELFFPKKDEDYLFDFGSSGMSRNRICSESSTVSSSSSSTSSSLKSHQEIDKLETLTEMFPSLSLKEAGGVLSLASGELERAVQIVLLQMEDNLTVKCKSDDEEETVDVKVLKDRLVKRYGFIDQAQDAKEFKPLLPKEEPKKLVRYREGQVVSTKGERYTEVAVNKDGEEVKIKTYISKPHKFH